MIIPIELDLVCMKVYIEDQQTLEEMMVNHGMSYGYSKFPALAPNNRKTAAEGTAIYYGVHQENSNHSEELKFYKDLSKGNIVAKIWTISTDDYAKIIGVKG